MSLDQVTGGLNRVPSQVNFHATEAHPAPNMNQPPFNLHKRLERDHGMVLEYRPVNDGQVRRLHEMARDVPPPPAEAGRGMICCGVPLLIFLAGVFVFAAVALILWAVLSLLILGPVLLVASMMGVSLWGWGWILYGLLGWVDQKFLGGMISRFWIPRMQAQESEGGGDGGEGGEEGEGEKKDN
ncbi:hypothetical protein N7507_010855 [Penicillium longicatenatum]|nr:hypothetical protein N7507_010855 [Penicillium longicatenatum]